jgi:hypothetical protein
VAFPWKVVDIVVTSAGGASVGTSARSEVGIGAIGMVSDEAGVGGIGSGIEIGMV